MPGTCFGTLSGFGQDARRWKPRRQSDETNIKSYASNTVHTMDLKVLPDVDQCQRADVEFNAHSKLHYWDDVLPRIKDAH